MYCTVEATKNWIGIVKDTILIYYPLQLQITVRDITDEDCRIPMNDLMK